MLSSIPAAGRVVHVRQRTWLVTGADADCVRLSCLDDDLAGETGEVLWHLEPGARVLAEQAGMNHVDHLDDPQVFGAYLSALRWHTVTSTDKRLLQAPFRAGIDLMPYQLEPLRKALELPRVNLFIADDVGLGKTIEAGLVLQELLLRQRIDRVLVICPPAVAPQWQEELDQRFGLSFAIYDNEYVAARRRERGWGVNPWSTGRQFIVSTTLLRGRRAHGRAGVPQTDHHDLLVQLLEAEAKGNRTGKVSKSLLIFDEAHHAAPASDGQWGIDSRTTKALRELAKRFEHRLFLSATPHNGLSNSFAALLALLDPQRFARATRIDGARELAPVMVRRLKKNLREEVGGLPERVLVDHTVRLAADDPELQLGRLLDDYDTAYRQSLKHLPPGEQNARGLVLIRLHKHLLSSIAAFASTLEVHARSREAAAERRQSLAPRPVPAAADLFADLAELADEATDGLDAQDDEAAEADADSEAEGIEALTALPADARAAALLGQMRRLAAAHAQRPDGRLRALATWINENLIADRRWQPTRVVIFTEFEPTLRWLAQQLPALLATADTEGRIEYYSGQQGEDRRAQLQAAFVRDPRRDPLRILLATDAAREGLNLQFHCHNLFHFDLPWNPSRVEQRNGRIDRKLQPEPTVYCHYFDLPDRPEDKVLTYMVRRLGRVAEELGSLSAVLSHNLAKRFENEGLRHITPQVIDAACAPSDRALEAAQALEGRYAEDTALLRGDLKTLENQLERSRKAAGYDTEQLRHVVDLGLRMVCGEGLTPVAPATDPASYHLPVQQLDATWAPTLAPLRAAPNPDDPHWRVPPVRPVAFRAAHQLDGDTVQLHLGHPLVKRLLARFRAQGFAATDLQRVTLLHTPDSAVRRVVLIGRLSLFGDGASRLHETLIEVAGQWSADETPTPYKADALATAVRELDKALSQGAPAHPQAAEATPRIKARVKRDVDALLPALKALADEREAQARKLLDERGAAEATEMETILDRQKGRILDAQDQRGQLQQTQLLLYTPAERAQFELDVRALADRLAQLEKERTEEPEAIRQSYRVSLRRFEVVGLVYLWP